MITRLKLHNYKSIAALDLELPNPLILVGPNGGGKSNLIDAITFLRDLARDGLPRALERHGDVKALRHWPGEPDSKVRIEAEYRQGNQECNYRVALTDVGGKSRISEEYVNWKDVSVANIPIRPATAGEPTSGMVVGMKYDFNKETGIKQKFIVNILIELEENDVRQSTVIESDYSNFINEEDCAAHSAINFHGLLSIASTNFISQFELYNIIPLFSAKPQEKPKSNRLTIHGNNLHYELHNLSDDNNYSYQAIRAAMQRIIPGLDNITVAKLGNFYLPQFRVRHENGEERIFYPAELSEGTLRALGILTALYQVNRPHVIAIEEPELGLHPGLLAVIADAVKEVCQSSQVILTTHSPHFLDFFEPENVMAVTLENGETRVAPIAEVQFKAVKDKLFSLGELMVMEGLRPK